MRATFQKTPFRFAADLIFGLSLFVGTTAVTFGTSAAPGLVGIANEGKMIMGTPLMMQSLTSSYVLATPSYKFIILATVFSGLFALNFAFVRHLRRATAAMILSSPRSIQLKDSSQIG